jgi:hypothetical protein
MPVDGKGLITELTQTQLLFPPGLRVRVREDPAMKEMTLVKGERVSVSHEVQGSLPGVPVVKEVTKIVRRMLQICGFQQGVDDRFALSRNG